MWTGKNKHEKIRPNAFWLILLFLISILIFPLHSMYLASSQTGIAYVPISIDNNQPISTPAPFQQSITINPSLYSIYEATNLGNIRFYATFSGTEFSNPLAAWLESYSGSPTPNLATSATIWFSISSGIAAASSLTIYMVFEYPSTQFDGATWGESPYLSPNFGQYDNGANVFTVYNNGGSIFPLSQTGTGGIGPTAISSATSPYTHAITASVSGGGSGAPTWSTNGETTTSLPSSYIAQALIYLSGASPLTDLLTNVGAISTGPFYVFRFDARGGSYDLIGNYASGASSTSIISQSASTSITNTWYQMTAVDASDILSMYKSTTWDLTNFGSLETGPIQGKGYAGGGVALTTDGATSTEFWTMITVRAYPPNGAMPSSSIGSFVKTAPPIPYSNTYLQTSGTVQLPSTDFGTTTAPAYVPIVIGNTQSVATRSGLQVLLQVDLAKYETYLSSDAGNVRFFNSSTFSNSFELPAWLETFSGNTTDAASTATQSEIWLSLRGTVIGAYSSITIYMVFESRTDFGSYWGEAPQLSPIIGEFDNGAKVFAYYNVSPANTSGWTIGGTAGLTSAAPSGSHFKLNTAFYANSANGDFLDSSIANLGTNEVITFWVYTTGLGNVFFLDNSLGSGQMARLDSRGGGNWAGLAGTSSWTSWNAPSSGLDEIAENWYKYDIVVNSTGASSYIGPSSDNISTLGTKANSINVSPLGNYIGLVGDGLGASYVTYWNGFVVRYSPPNNVAPAVTIGSIVMPAISETVMPQLDKASVTLFSGLEFYENSSATTCSSPRLDTSLAQPVANSSFSFSPGASYCLWSQELPNSSALIAGNWTLDLWASATILPSALQVSIYATNSTGSVLSTIVSATATNTIQTTKTEVLTKLSGSGANLQSNSYLKVVMNSQVGSSPFTIYFGTGQFTNFQSPDLFSQALIINNTSSSPVYASLGVASSSNSARLANLSAWFSNNLIPQIQLGSSISTPIVQGVPLLINAHSGTYLCLNAKATSLGESTLVLSMKVQLLQGEPYAQYLIILQMN